MSDDLGARRPGEHLRSNPYRTAAHEKGADGEAYVGILLNRLPVDRWTVLHSIPVAGIGDIDHLVIGPPGVVVINTKNHSGKSVMVDGDAIRVAGRETDYVSVARRHERVIRECLRRAGAPELLIRSILAFVVDGRHNLATQSAPHGVDVLWADDLIDALLALPTVASSGDIAMTAALARRSATWGRATSGPGRSRQTIRVEPMSVSGKARRIAQAGRLRALVVGLPVALLLGGLIMGLVGALVPGPGATSVDGADSARDDAGNRPASAAERVQPVPLPSPPVLAYALYSDDSLDRFIEASLATREPTIDVGAWLTRGTSDSEIAAVTAQVETQSPYIYVTSWSMSDGVIAPVYRYEPLAYQSQQIRAALGIAQAADQVRAAAVDDSTDRKAVVAAIHDALASAAVYDSGLATAYSEGGLGPTDDAPDAASAFRPFGTIGLGYARAFSAIAAELGVDASVVVGTVDGQRHAWNAVEIDGTTFVVDVALDDSTGKDVSHERLLMDQEQARAFGYEADVMP